jgi:hypothetical protein
MKRTHSTTHTLKKQGYDNIEFYAPTGELMFFSSQSRLDFYLSKDLVEKIGNKKYQLKFEPKGLGYSDEYSSWNSFCLEPRANRCVVSGETDYTKLTKHHIVPTYFRKHFPIEHKISFQMVVLLEHEIHANYSKEEIKFHDILAIKYGIETPLELTEQYNRATANIKLATAILLYGHKMPKADYELTLKKFEAYTGLPPTTENLKKIVETPTSYYHPNCNFRNSKKKFHLMYSEFDFGKKLASKIVDYREFEEIWIRHFVEKTQPKYLPEDLKKTYKIV